MDERIDRDRRRFLGTVALTMAGAQFASTGTMDATERAPRELDALGRATEWLNSPRPTVADLLGKVVVVDFCTYTCINWLRTLPYVRAWSKKYAQGLVLIGVHTPEFAFEHNLDNVRRAIQQMKIEHPIVIDNDYSIWRAFNNQYWPALYFIDARGRVRDHHFGEGEYERSERVMQRLLSESGNAAAGTGLVAVGGTGIEAAPDWGNLRSPENYLGYARTENFASPGGALSDRRQGAHIRFRVSIDEQPPGPARGGDVDEGGNGTVAEQRLYQLVRQPRPIDDRRFEIEFLAAGAEAFAFTFG